MMAGVLKRCFWRLLVCSCLIYLSACVLGARGDGFASCAGKILRRDWRGVSKLHLCAKKLTRPDEVKVEPRVLEEAVEEGDSKHFWPPKRPKPGPKLKPKPWPKPEPKSGPKPEPKPGPGPKPEPKPKPKFEPKPHINHPNRGPPIPYPPKEERGKGHGKGKGRRSHERRKGRHHDDRTHRKT